MNLYSAGALVLVAIFASISIASGIEAWQKVEVARAAAATPPRGIEYLQCHGPSDAGKFDCTMEYRRP